MWAHALDVVVFLEGSIATRVFAVRQSEHPSRGFCVDALCADLFCPSVNGACPTLLSSKLSKRGLVVLRQGLGALGRACVMIAWGSPLYLSHVGL